MRLVGEILPLCRDEVGVFYRLGFVGHSTSLDQFNISMDDNDTTLCVQNYNQGTNILTQLWLNKLKVLFHSIFS